MGVSNDVISNHVSAWEAKLQASYRRHWPSRLFRHEVLENAVEVLKSGRLLSRQDAGQDLIRDVAPDEIIGITDAAHRYVRLYFRPRTPTQYRIEGIRRAEEVWNGKHAPVLYMFVFRSANILTKESVNFSAGNMQIPGTQVLDGDDQFRSLNFDKIYHEGPYDAELHPDIKVWRCAEILSGEPLELNDDLEAIVCRSHAERQTLLHMLGADALRWSSKISIVTQPGFFNAEYAYVEAVDLNSDGMAVRFHPRRKEPMATWVSANVSSLDNFLHQEHWPRQELDLRKTWTFGFEPRVGRYLFELQIDDENAFTGIFNYGEDPF